MGKDEVLVAGKHSGRRGIGELAVCRERERKYIHLIDKWLWVIKTLYVLP